MKALKCQDCGTPLGEHSGRGRPRVRCTECAALRRKEKEYKRRAINVVYGPLRPCCADAIKANVIGYGPDGSFRIRKAKKRLKRCPQCKTAYRFGKTQRAEDLVANRSAERTTQFTKVIGTKKNLGMEWESGSDPTGPDAGKIAAIASDLGDIGDGKNRGPGYDVRAGNSTWDPSKQGLTNKEKRLAKEADRLLNADGEDETAEPDESEETLTPGDPRRLLMRGYVHA